MLPLRLLRHSVDCAGRYEWDDLGYAHDSHYQDCSSEVRFA
jgi:hypothetical protein